MTIRTKAVVHKIKMPNKATRNSNQIPARAIPAAAVPKVRMRIRAKASRNNRLLIQARAVPAAAVRKDRMPIQAKARTVTAVTSRNNSPVISPAIVTRRHRAAIQVQAMT